MRCGNCNVFVSQEPGEVQVENADVDHLGHVTIEVRITQNCVECGTELKEATLIIERDVNDFHEGHGALASSTRESDSRHSGYSAEVDLDNTEWAEGSGRGRRTFYGVGGTVTVQCACGASTEISIECSEEHPDTYIAASSMDCC